MLLAFVLIPSPSYQEVRTPISGFIVSFSSATKPFKSPAVHVFFPRFPQIYLPAKSETIDVFDFPKGSAEYSQLQQVQI
jgi:hypothetical protein